MWGLAAVDGFTDAVFGDLSIQIDFSIGGNTVPFAVDSDRTCVVRVGTLIDIVVRFVVGQDGAGVARTRLFAYIKLDIHEFALAVGGTGGSGLGTVVAVGTVIVEI